MKVLETWSNMMFWNGFMATSAAIAVTGGFCGNTNADNGVKCCLDSFSVRGPRGYSNFPSLGSPQARKSEKNTHWKDPRGG